MISKAGSLDPLEAEVPSLIGKIGWEIETGIHQFVYDVVSDSVHKACPLC